MKHDSQKYYDEHYSIDNVAAWKTWTPNPLFLNKHISDFQGSFWYETLHEIIYPEIASFSNSVDSVLDIGCSAGDFLIPLSSYSRQTFGVDIVKFSTPWSLLKRDYGIQCQQINLDESDLPWDESNFDVVTMLMVLEHVFDVHHAISEVVRVVKPGGLVTIQVPNIAYVKNRIELGFGKLPCTSNVEKRDNLTEWDGQHLHYFTCDSLASLLQQHGLEPYKFKCSGRLSRVRSLHTSLWGADIIVFAHKKLILN